MAKLTDATSRPRQVVKAILVLLGTSCLVLALVQPQFGTKLEMVSRRGVDVIVALDVSRSMLAQDLKPNRLERARFEVTSFIDRLEGDRVGLVAFAGQSLVLCPLTLDYGAAKLFLDAADTDAVPYQGTAIAEAIRAAGRAFGSQDRKYKALVLITDGEDHAGRVLEAARQAGDEGVRIFAVGVGTPDGELIPIGQEGQGDFLKDQGGNVVKSRLDEGALREIARITDGGYVRSGGGRVGLEEVYAQVDAMEKRDLGSRRYTQFVDRYQWPLGLALALFLVEGFLSDRRVADGVWRGRFE
jgi:Ca-activated chloride channel family protein